MSGNNPSPSEKQTGDTAPALFYSLPVLNLIPENPKLDSSMPGPQI